MPIERSGSNRQWELRENCSGSELGSERTYGTNETYKPGVIYSTVAVQAPDLFQAASKVFSVGELTRTIRRTLAAKFAAVWVQGEISNYKLHPSGHQYFTLKDQRAAISCVIFRNTLPPGGPPISDGAQVQIYGNISVFEARGQYQISVQILQTRGAGLLQAKFEALKRKLEAEGLFDPARKRPLPKFPKRIGIVTSPSGAAIRFGNFGS